MNELDFTAPKLPKPITLFVTLLLIVAAIEIISHCLTPFIVPDSHRYLQSAFDSLFLATLASPFIWLLIARPLRTIAMTEMSRTKATLGNMGDAVLNFECDGTITWLNPAAERMFGYEAREMAGKNITHLIPGIRESLKALLFDRSASEPDPGFRLGSETACRRDESCFPVEISISRLHVEGRWLCIAIIHDISQRKQHAEQLEYQANHDALTSLPNRNLLSDRIQQALLMSSRNHQQTAILFVDLDHFKFINDSLGHDAGDQLLKIVAERLTACMRAGDTVARHGGDEFVITVSGLTEADEVTQIARKIDEAIARPFMINDHELIVTCSIGISMFPKDGADVQTLIKNADVAMYRAKEQGRNTFQFYTHEMNVRSLARMTMEKHLRRALERNELLLHYQPKVNLRNGRITSMEALIRWQSPEMGLISPVKFIPLAEETGLIEPIGEWVIRTACAQNKAWQDAGLPALTVAVNLSARQFRQANIARIIGQALHETGLEPRFLELELTESLVLQDVDRVMATLNELKGMGLYLTMDDFGTGYSSLSYLKRFPFDKLKVDQSFVRDITRDPDSAAIVKTIVAMAHSLHLKVIAEGVETEGQLNYLRSLDCDEIQGYYFSRPICAPDFQELLRKGNQLQLPPEDGQGSKKTVLVVDDERNVLNALQRVLLLDGYQVLTAGSAAEGFELLANNHVSVIISDLRMPEMNGTEFLSRVKGLHPDTVRIILSGHADLNAVTEAINQGAIYKFLNKPWDDESIRLTVSEAFTQHRTLSRRETRASADGAS